MSGHTGEGCIDCGQLGATLCKSCTAHRADGHEPRGEAVNERSSHNRVARVMVAWCHGAGPNGHTYKLLTDRQREHGRRLAAAFKGAA